MYIPDNYDRWEAYDAERQRELDMLPECSECENPIQDEHCYEVNGELICPGCMEKNHRKWTDDYCD
jgi:formylmethanofuran dehydrogenase subunit E